MREHAGTRTHDRALTIAALLFTSACTPPRTAGGVVRVNDAACTSPASAPTSRGLAAARVRIECPKGNGASERIVALELRADEGGRFATEKAPPIPLDCEIVVEGPGAIARRYPVADHCTSDYPGPIWDNHENACHNLWLDATLFAAPTERDGGAP